jgi:outer membrane protein insertion porin family
MSARRAVVALIVALWVPAAAAQRAAPVGEERAAPLRVDPETVEILGLSVEGVANEGTQSFVQRASGLTVGQQVTLPGDQAFAEAIRSIYDLGLFSDVKIVQERRVGDGVYLAIRVQEEPLLADYTFEGVKKGHRKDLEKQVPLIKRRPVRPGDIERAEQVIKDYFKEKGHLMAEVDVARTVTPENTVNLAFNVERGPVVEVGNVIIEGNEALDDGDVRGQMDTKTDSWWRFWSKAKFDPKKYEADLQAIVNHYNEKGYYDAKIVSDSVYVVEEEGKDPEIAVKVRVHEGPRYHIRNIAWEGNTVYPDQVLTAALGFEPGEPYNSKQLEENLYANKNSSDVASLYMNQGYMRFNVQPSIRVVEGDSMDVHFDVFEGDVYEFGNITIEGNTKTKDHVVRRELYTIPGQTFSREAIQESIRRLAQLSYFNQEALASGPTINIDEQRKAVDLGYTLEEVGDSQLELSGTWGRYGLVLMLRFGFNNFSIQDLFNGGAWKPIPSGDGQKLSLGIQTNGSYYQSYSLSFTEPWFRGRPTPVGFAVSHSRFSRNPYLSELTSGANDIKFRTTSARVFYDQRLKWPDDKFTLSTGVRYQFFNNRNFAYTLPEGISQELTLQTSLTRNELDNPLFPRSGSLVQLSLDVAPQIPGTDFIQYHKWRFKTNWNVPITSAFTLSLATDYGYIGSLNGDPVDFQRFIVGGSPFDSQGFNDFFGKDLIYMRGYPRAAIGPVLENPASPGRFEPQGGRILNRYSTELRWMAIQSPQLQAAPYVFLDAANAWDSFATFNPAALYRSTGVGVRLFLPILGMLELTYGYNLDEFTPIPGVNHSGERRWLFQFSLGQGFNQ